VGNLKGRTRAWGALAILSVLGLLIAIGIPVSRKPRRQAFGP
jgi:hypothetical protein